MQNHLKDSQKNMNRYTGGVLFHVILKKVCK